MNRRIHYFSEWCENHNYYSSKFVFPEASPLLDIQYQLDGVPVEEKRWLWRGHVLNTGWQLLADVRFLVIHCRQLPVSRNFTLSVLKPVRWKRKRKEFLHIGIVRTEAAGLAPHQATVPELFGDAWRGGEDGCSAVPNCPHFLCTRVHSCTGTSLHSSSSWLTLHTIQPAGRRGKINFWTAGGFWQWQKSFCIPIPSFPMNSGFLCLPTCRFPLCFRCLPSPTTVPISLLSA